MFATMKLSGDVVRCRTPSGEVVIIIIDDVLKNNVCDNPYYSTHQLDFEKF